MKIFSTFTIFSALLLFSIIGLSAQDQKEYTGSLLWKISGNGLTQPSYILGTHHLAHVSFTDSIPGLKDVMKSTEQTVGELLMSEQAEMQAKLQQAAMMPAGETYKSLLSTDEYATLDAGLKEIFTVGLDQLSQLKPGMISMMYTIMLYTKHYPKFNPMAHEAIDAYVQRIANENGKNSLGLETVEDQIYAIFDAEPLKDQAKSLACAVGNKDWAVKGLNKLNMLYKSKDLKGMYDLAFNDPDEPCKMSQTYQSAINKDRNNKWLEKLPLIMKEKSSLIAVGALHLAGKEGLLYQLAKKGYKVEPVR